MGWAAADTGVHDAGERDAKTHRGAPLFWC